MFSLNTTILFFFVGNEDFVIISCSFQRNFVYFTFPFFKCIFRRKLTISCMTSILQNLSHFDQQLWPQSSPVSLYHPLSPPITPFAPLFWTFWPHVSISSRLQNVNPSLDTSWTSHSLDFSWSLVFKKHSFANTDLYPSKCSPRRCSSLSSYPFKIIPQISQLKVASSSLINDQW